MLDDYLAARRAATGSGHRPLAEELDLVNVFADLAELSRNRPTGEDGGGSHIHSAREYFHTYLQSLDVERAGLPETFQARLAKALGHYGVTELDRSPELEAAVFRIFLAQQRASADATVIAALLRAWLREPGAGRDAARAGRPRAGAAGGRDTGPLPRGRRPRPRRGVRLVRPAAAAPQPRPRLRPGPHAPAPPGRAPGRAGPRRAHRRDGRSTEPLVRLLGQRLGPRPPRQRRHAGGADPAVLRQQGAHRRPHPRGRGLHVRRSPSARDSSVVSAAVRFDALGGALRGLAELAERRGPHRRRHLPRLGEPAGGLRRDGGRAARGHQRAPAAPAGPQAHRHRRGPRRRGDAPPLHVPPVEHRDDRGTADPRPAPVHRGADAAGAAAQVRPHPAALVGRGGLPLPVRGAGEPGPTSAWSRSRRCAT